MAEHSNFVGIATQLWKKVFNETPYSSFGMMDAIAKHLGLSYKDILRNPEKLKEFDPKLFPKMNLCFLAWSSDIKTGRCTSFALEVARLLEEAHPDKFSFEYYDTGGHRVALCAETRIMINSSSKVGAEVIAESEKWNHGDGTWEHVDGKWIYETTTKNGKKKAFPISREMAIGTCFREVAEKAILILLFRSISVKPDLKESDHRDFYGMVKWNVNMQRIELTPDMRRRQNKIFISFSRRGTKQTLAECVHNMKAFIENHGVSRQWKFDGTDQIHEAFWQGAVESWGHPIWTPLEAL